MSFTQPAIFARGVAAAGAMATMSAPASAMIEFRMCDLGRYGAGDASGLPFSTM